jgi:hypothetical protein
MTYHTCNAFYSIDREDPHSQALIGVRIIIMLFIK